MQATSTTNKPQQFSHFAADRVDLRRKQEMIDYLASHDTRREMFRAPRFANNVKFNWGALRSTVPEPYLSAAGRLLDSEDPRPWHEIEWLFDEFARDNPGAHIEQAGRSGGWFELVFDSDPLEYIGARRAVDTFAVDCTFAELRALVRTVRAFDAACDSAVSIFMEYAITDYLNDDSAESEDE